MMSGVSVILFDLGGVLVQLTGVETLLAWLQHRVTAEQLWALWLRSPSVRAFETGQMDADSFANAIIAELDLGIDSRQFIDAFTGWQAGLYPGALELIARIPKRYRRAVLSNTNALHWSRTQSDFGLEPLFDAHFASHLTGKIKPDAAAFQHVVDVLECAPQHVLFLDDNILNVEAAVDFGMHARVVRGVEAARAILVEAGISLSEGMGQEGSEPAGLGAGSRGVFG